MNDSRAQWVGFRFSATDAVILVCGIALAALLRAREFPLWWLVPMVLGHFFLFCNVFRVRRSYEITWAFLFLLNVGFWLSRARFDWAAALLTQTPFTLAAIGAEMLSWRYHGVAARRINSRLSEYVAHRSNLRS